MIFTLSLKFIIIPPYIRVTFSIIKLTFTFGFSRFLNLIFFCTHDLVSDFYTYTKIYRYSTFDSS